MKAMLRAVLCAVCALMLALPAGAQLDPGNFEIFQDGNKVGEIFVPERSSGQANYVEHWVLFSAYVYPGGKLARQIEIKPSPRSYASLDDFLAKVPWGPGYRYVRIEATDTDKLPDRVPPVVLDTRKVSPTAPNMPARKSNKAVRINPDNPKVDPTDPSMPTWAREVFGSGKGGGAGGGR